MKDILVRNKIFNKLLLEEERKRRAEIAASAAEK
jgi:hypothetical protein